MTIIHNTTTSLASKISKIIKNPKILLKRPFNNTTHDTVTLHSNIMNRNITVKKAGEILKNEIFYDDTHSHPIGQTNDKGILYFYDSHKDCLVKAKFLDKSGSGKGDIGFKDYDTSHKKSIFAKHDYIAMGTQAETEIFLQTLLSKDHDTHTEEDVFEDSVEIFEQNILKIQENYTLSLGEKALLISEKNDKNHREIYAHLNKCRLQPKSLLNAKKIAKTSLIGGAIAGAVVISLPSMGVPIPVMAACWGGITLLGFVLKR